jgi:hypothetical protein
MTAKAPRSYLYCLSSKLLPLISGSHESCPRKQLSQPVGTTLERYIMRKQLEFAYATGELSQLLRDIAWPAKS